MSRTNDKAVSIQKKLNRRIANNLSQLIEDNNINKSALCKVLEKDGKVTIDRSALSRFLNHPDDSSMGLTFIVSCAEYFKVPVDAILSADINKYFSNGAGYQELTDFSDEDEIQSFISDTRSEIFIEDAQSYYFRSYYEEYYCYYYSTVSDENRGNDPIITGKLKLFARGNKYWAELLIDTKTVTDGKKNYKRYVGPVVLSLPTLAMHALLREESVGEFCNIIIRHSQANFNKLDCRMALVLSTASTPDKRYPVVHRMFLSHEAIKPEDLKLIAPHLCMNTSKIVVSKEDLLGMKENAADYEAIIDELLAAEDTTMYSFKEKNIKAVCSKIWSNEEINVFLSELRNVSVVHRYNKVSIGVDINLRDILFAAGYYQ